MPLFSRNLTDLTADTLEELSTTTNITRLSAGSKARALLDAVNKRLEEAYESFDLNMARAFVSAAPGQYLDLIGDLLGVTRTSSVAATIDGDLEIVKFYVDTGTFGDINGGNAIVVNEGSVISTQPNQNGITYRVTSTETLLASASAGFVSAEAIQPGTAGNVGADSLVYHNVIDYSDVDNGTLKVTNVHPIANGANLESDANFRYRISNRVLEAQAANETSIRLSVLSTPGVSDVLIVPRYRGIGTFGLIIESVTPTVTQNLLDDVTARVELMQGLGTIAYIRGPKEAGLTIRTTVEYGQQYDQDALDDIEDELDNTIRSFVSDLGIGDEWSVNRMVSEMFRVSSKIKNFGIAGTPLEEVYVYTESKVQDNRVKERLLGDYSPDSDERVIIEPSVTNAITFDRKFSRRL